MIATKEAFLKSFVRHLGLRKGDLQSNSEQTPELYVPLEEAADLDAANLVISRFKGEGIETHAVLIDLDMPHEYVPSSTEGHGHLLLDMKLTRRDWRELMIALAKAGVIQPGYRDFSLQRGFASLRLPWIKKEDVGSK